MSYTSRSANLDFRVDPNWLIPLWGLQQYLFAVIIQQTQRNLNLLICAVPGNL